MIFKILRNTFILLFISFFDGCKTTNEKIIDEGTIEYEAKVVDENHPWAGMAPSIATLRFKESNFIFEMSTMGMFTTVFISNQNNKTLTQTVKFLDIKEACIEKQKQVEKENEDYKIKFEECNETKVIAGYTCKKLKITMVDNPNIAFDAYYTKEMGNEEMNALSPYKGVKGMLMQYRLKKMGLEMQFTAKSVKRSEIAENDFEIPAYFKIVSKQDIEKIFTQF